MAAPAVRCMPSAVGGTTRSHPCRSARCRRRGGSRRRRLPDRRRRTRAPPRPIPDVSTRWAPPCGTPRTGTQSTTAADLRPRPCVPRCAGRTPDPTAPSCRAPAPAGSRRDGHPIQRSTHEVLEVRPVELLAYVCRRITERGLEALDRLAATLDVREVRREQAHIVAGLFDDPADVLRRIRRRSHLAVHVVTRAHRQV